MYILSGKRKGGDLKGDTVVCAAIFLILFVSTEAFRMNSNQNIKSLISREKRQFTDSEDEIDVTKLTSQQVLQLLLNRFKSKTSRPQPRMILQQLSDKDMADICAKSASVTCGKQALEKLVENDGIGEKCTVRKEFLECIDNSRRDCKTLAATGIYPMLPSQSEIRIIREKVGKALWTSGGCTFFSNK